MTTAARRPDRSRQLPLPPRPAAAVGYVSAAPEEASNDLFTDWCRRRAAADGWILTEMVNGTDDLIPLAERAGWQHITQLLTDGSAGAVITINRAMVADTTRDWVRVCDLLACLGATLTTGAASRITTSGTIR
ncbi:hypothetical protein ACFXKJ_35800 [Kitasatospora indigofera]|uniref:hypothetical protein n=2 Tax=Kitasatospora indigofera TaxID=67307 RepID=UPI003680CCB8